MASKNKIITNPVTGQSIQFLRTASETRGQLLEMETIYRPHSMEPTVHYHPKQKEDFKVLEGELTVNFNGRIFILKEGDIFHIPANKIHSMWNAGSKPARVNWQVRPAMDTEFLLETTFGLAADGKVNSKGTPFFLQAVPILLKYSNVFRLAKPPYAVQQIILNLVRPFSLLSGKTARDKRYID
ncbi:MAG: cupin domain-containing protein [Citrobacter freundii]|nr:MAG: cupin domain-containing protein [Citrobacter freundii]